MLLKFFRPTLNLNNSIAIVGSSGNLLKKEYGPIIDSHKEVVRFNRAPTKGYEKHVGSRTTIRVVNQHVFCCTKHNGRGEQIMADGTKGVWTDEGQPQYFLRDEVRDCAILHIGQPNRKVSFEKGLQFVHDSCTAHKGDLRVLHTFYHNFQPSVGLAFIYAVLKSIKNPTINLYGFGGLPGGEGNQAMSHYWENRDNIGPSHNFNLEKKLLEDLHRKKILTINR
jgi:hypothetical protein